MFANISGVLWMSTFLVMHPMQALADLQNKPACTVSTKLLVVGLPIILGLDLAVGVRNTA
jgi:hypothetical protein